MVELVILSQEWPILVEAVEDIEINQEVDQLVSVVQVEVEYVLSVIPHHSRL